MTVVLAEPVTARAVGDCVDCHGSGVTVDSDGSFSGMVGTLVPCYCTPEGDACLMWNPREWRDYVLGTGQDWRL
jgi:hypothetical protein